MIDYKFLVFKAITNAGDKCILEGSYWKIFKEPNPNRDNYYTIGLIPEQFEEDRYTHPTIAVTEFGMKTYFDIGYRDYANRYVSFKNQYINDLFNNGKVTDETMKTELRKACCTDLDAEKKYQEGYKNGFDAGLDEFDESITPKQIIYNPPATIVFWEDGDKTVVKCTKGEPFNKYYGFCAALAKRIYGSNSQIMKIVNSGHVTGKESTNRIEKCNKKIKNHSKNIEQIKYLKYKQHMSYADIAKKLNLPESSVRNMAQMDKKGTAKNE